ncbi:MAG: sulfotransferase [Pseudoxanthomonas sp.]
MNEQQLKQRYAQAVDALNRRQWPAARRLAEALLPHVPGHAGLHFVIGVAALETSDLKSAFRHLTMACQLNAARADYAAMRARVLMECRALPEAVAEAERALTLDAADPTALNPMALNVLAVVFSRANAHARAAEAFRRACQAVPNEASLHFNLATSLMALGDIDGAIAACEESVRLDPSYWRAHLILAQLSKQTPERNHLPRLRSLLQRADTPEAKLYLNLALEKELDDLGEYPQAMRHLIEGKRAWQVRLPRPAESDEQVFQALIDACGPLPAVPAGVRTRAPIFVFGMPRSGTTLVERIVSSHSQVHSAGELEAFPVAFKKLSRVDSPLILDSATLAALPRMDWRALGQAYLDATRPMVGDTPRFIDKLPQNFLYAGLIARALPDATLICLRRDAMDTCVGNFRQLFTLTSPLYNYCFDLEDTGRYYLLFDRLMAHWRAVMPGRILEIRYEDVVDDQAGSTRRLLEHCGLQWEDACLRFEQNAAPISTASSVQVRSKIYRSSLQRWRRYGELVEPLRRILQAGGIAVPDIP